MFINNSIPISTIIVCLESVTYTHGKCHVYTRISPSTFN